MTDSANQPQPISEAMRLRARAALIIVGLLVILVAVMLPVVIYSLSRSLSDVEQNPVYDLVTGEVETNPELIESDDIAYANISFAGIDESTRAATLLISGNRICVALCPPTTFGFYSLDNDGSMRRGLPPSVMLDFPGGKEGTGPFTRTITLPVSGNPQRYPFDRYTLLLGMTAVATKPDGSLFPLPQAMFDERVVLSAQNSMVRLKMAEIEIVDPATVTPKGSTEHFLIARRMVFQRPFYLEVLCSLLVLLISASGFFALATQTLRQLSIGIGGLILGIWGVRSIVIQGNLPEVTIVDSVLAIIILILLLGIAIRVAFAVRNQTGWGDH